MNTVWILVCDAARGRLFEIRGNDPSWNLLEVFTEEATRTKAHEPAPTDVEKGHFAHALVTKLDQAMRSKRFNHWVLVAPPHFLGMMKNELTPELQKHLMTTVDKDLTHVGAPELMERLAASVRIPVTDKEAFQEATKHAH